MLRAHVEFLASDDMKGRPCPSATCDLAADYIRAQFIGAGLETQFQTTEAIFEIRRGDVTVQAYRSEAAFRVSGVRYSGSHRSGRQDDKPGGGISIEKTTELDPIYNATGTIHVTNVPAGMRNVIGVLKGSDPVLRDTYVLVTAHYDHIGVKAQGRGRHDFQRRQRQCQRSIRSDRDGARDRIVYASSRGARSCSWLISARSVGSSGRDTTRAIRCFRLIRRMRKSTLSN